MGQKQTPLGSHLSSGMWPHLFVSPRISFCTKILERSFPVFIHPLPLCTIATCSRTQAGRQLAQLPLNGESKTRRRLLGCPTLNCLMSRNVKIKAKILHPKKNSPGSWIKCPPISEGSTLPGKSIPHFKIPHFKIFLVCLRNYDLKHRFCSQTAYIQTQIHYVTLCKLLHYPMP